MLPEAGPITFPRSTALPPDAPLVHPPVLPSARTERRAFTSPPAGNSWYISMAVCACMLQLLRLLGKGSKRAEGIDTMPAKILMSKKGSPGCCAVESHLWLRGPPGGLGTCTDAGCLLKARPERAP